MSAPRKPIERFPFDALTPIIEARWREPNPDLDAKSFLGHIGVVGKARDVTGLSRHRLARWRDNGLTLEAADEVAWALGLHPAEIWPEQWSSCAA